MNRASLLSLLVLGCQSEVQQTEIALPLLYISAQSIDFGEVVWGETNYRTLYIENQGELPMGVHPLVLSEEGFESSFSINYFTESIICEDIEASSTSTTTDTGSTETESEDTDEDAPNLGEGDFLLNPGCRIAVELGYTPSTIGDSYASFYVHSFIEEPATNDDDEESSTVTESAFVPSFYRDPVDFKKPILLHGYSMLGNGNILVTPRTLDFGHLWTGETITKQVMINNVGDGNLLLGQPYLSSDCNTDVFSIDLSTLDSDYTIPAEQGTLFEATFTPENIEDAYCTLIIPSDDVDSPEIEVRLKGNVGRDPSNQAPSVTLVNPPVGYLHTTGGNLLVEVSMFDVNQPANTLLCKVKSVNQGAGIYNCNPNTESGFTVVEIPIENLVAGVDTLLVTVTDQSELQGFASTTILFGTSYPESDDDGDGYGSEGDVIDCDDNDVTVYPFAAEIVDGKDNDCDGSIDERTTAGDDDGDSVSEEEGDCDDNDIASYPNAPEQPDLKDNDCDGTIDENTSLFDDDGDGFTEVDNDCNDNNPDINPAAVELCDGIDNNCNNLRDEQEGCVTIDSEPKIIAGIQMDAKAISVGESTTMTVFVHEADGQELSFTWEEDSALSSTGHTAISNSSSQNITWTAPTSVSGDGQVFSVYVVVIDEDGNQDWVFDEISVYSNPIERSIIETTIISGQGGCSTTAAMGSLLPLFIFGGLVVLRRREEH
jgi:hypothetical protein